VTTARGAFIGRRREIEELLQRRRDAAEGRGRIVLVGGEAGIGKSRLLRQFESIGAGGRAPNPAARCVEFVQIPLRPLRELLAQLERRASGPREPATRSLVERLAFERNPESAAGSLPGAVLFDSLDSAFARYALHGTLVLFIEDVHWADRSTLAFLTYLADRLERRRILIVATYRHDEVGSRHPNLSEFSALLSKRAVSTISLAPLDESAIRDLIDAQASRSSALSPGTVATIAKRSQGNPFFAEELIRSAVDAGQGDPIAELPLSIRAAVLARASQLTEEHRSVVSLAAVLGERFSVEQLVTLLKGDREIVLEALERARELRLLYDEPGAPGEVAFRHALTQEVLYGELLAERVRPLHEAIATQLEKEANRNAASVQLAHHWWRAGDLRRAAEYYEIAGDNAFVMGALADAVLYYEHALAARPNTAQAEHKLGVALGQMGELRGGTDRLRRAAALYWEAGDFEGYSENASVVVRQLHNTGDVGAAMAECQAAIAALRPKLRPERLDLFRAQLAFQCIAALDDDAASAFLDEIREPVEDSKVAMHLAWDRFRIAALRGEIEQWRLFASRALDAARRQDDGGFQLRLISCQIAIEAVGLGDVAAAREHFRVAMTLKPRQPATVMALEYAASALEHALRGDFAGAAELLRSLDSLALQSYPSLVHVKSASFVLGICAGDDSRLHREDTESFLRYGVERDLKLAVGLLGVPYAWPLGLRGETDEAAGWIARIALLLRRPHRFLFAYLAAAQFGRSEDVLTMRGRLVEAASRPQDRVNKAALGLFDAFAIRRGIVEADLRASALAAAAGFEEIGWPWLAARGYELGGELRRALETYRSLGAVRDLRRLEVERSDAGASALSSRELEVAELVSKGHSNEEISQILHISSRTAEKHVSSALKKLNLRSRLQLGRLLARSQTRDS